MGLLMQALLQILGWVVLLAAVAPVAMAGGQMIAAFMMGQNILPWVGVTLLTMALLVAGGLLALRVVMPFFEDTSTLGLVSLVSASVFLAGPWLAWKLGQRWIAKKV